MTQVLSPITFPISTHIVLASGSSARRDLLRAAGIPFEVQTAGTDEGKIRDNCRAEGISAERTALRLADAKAEAVAEKAGNPRALVIGADQMLSCEGQWFEKPSSPAQAREQLRQLRGRTHYLHSAVVIRQGEQTIWEHVSSPALTMRAFSDSFLEQYLTLDGGACLSCVGAYRLEGPGVHLFSHIQGDHSAILGLPLLPLLTELRRIGVLPI